MARRQQGEFNYGGSQSDIRAELQDYSKANGYSAHHFADATCNCSGRVFRLFIDDNEEAAVRECIACKEKHPIGDSGNYLANATLEECECPCGARVFEITAAVALYANSEDVRWFYLGCRCITCGLTACYGDWKNEFIDYKKLLEQI
jgi:hypothetical protein